jgi:hypothetical protein
MNDHEAKVPEKTMSLIPSSFPRKPESKAAGPVSVPLGPRFRTGEKISGTGVPAGGFAGKRANNSAALRRRQAGTPVPLRPFFHNLFGGDGAGGTGRGME